MSLDLEGWTEDLSIKASTEPHLSDSTVVLSQDTTEHSVHPYLSAPFLRETTYIHVTPCTSGAPLYS